MAEKSGKPFYLIVNSHDPHRPYYKHTLEGSEIKGRQDKLPNSHPSKVYKPADVTYRNSFRIIPKSVPS